MDRRSFLASMAASVAAPAISSFRRASQAGITAPVSGKPVSQEQSAVQERLQYAEDVFKFNQIMLRRNRTGQPPSSADQEWVHHFTMLRAWLNSDYKTTHVPRASWGITPLTDLGTGLYKGEQGGLYPDGKNVLPQAHLQAGLKIAKSIVPLDAGGRADPNGKIVFISIGYSNWTQEFSVFVSHALQDSRRNPKVQVIDCAVDAQSTEVSARPDAEYYHVVDKRLQEAGVTPRQVQVVMMKVATQAPALPFPWEPRFLEGLILKTVHVLKARFPDLKMMYLTSRIYGGYADVALNPEPHAFETGFAVKWLIADQIAGKSDLNCDPSRGAVRAPWLAWGPYLWADGVKGRKDGLQWFRDDMRANDHTHPSARGREKVATLVDQFMKTDPTARVWYLRSSDRN
jgi:hypothetical protein